MTHSMHVAAYTRQLAACNVRHAIYIVQHTTVKTLDPSQIAFRSPSSRSAHMIIRRCDRASLRAAPCVALQAALP